MYLLIATSLLFPILMGAGVFGSCSCQNELHIVFRELPYQNMSCSHPLILCSGVMNKVTYYGGLADVSNSFIQCATYFDMGVIWTTLGLP